MISGLRRLALGSGLWRNEGAYFVIFNVTNALNYAYLLFVGFFLSPESYGLFGALFGLVYLTSSLGNMVRVAVARHVAGAAGGATSRGLVVSSLRWPAAVALAVGLGFAAAAPFIRSGFDGDTASVAWTVAVVALSIWVPAGYGVLQGEQRFAGLGAVLMSAAAVRLACGLLLVALGLGVAGAMAGLALGYIVSAGHAVALSLTGRGSRMEAAPEQAPVRPSARSLAVVLVASAATAAPTSLDVALVRHLFSPAESGVFTAIAVLGRVVVFATVAIPFIALPKVAGRVSRGENPLPVLRWSLLLTAVIAIPVAVVVAVPIALGWPVVGADLSEARAALYWYLAAMVAFSMLIVFVYYHVGTGDSRYLLGLAAPAVALQAVLITLVPGSLTEVAQIVCAVNVGALAVSLLVTFRSPLPWRLRMSGAPEPVAENV